MRSGWRGRYRCPASPVALQESAIAPDERQCRVAQPDRQRQRVENLAQVGRACGSDRRWLHPHCRHAADGAAAHRDGARILVVRGESEADTAIAEVVERLGQLRRFGTSETGIQHRFRAAHRRAARRRRGPTRSAPRGSPTARRRVRRLRRAFALPALRKTRRSFPAALCSATAQRDAAAASATAPAATAERTSNCSVAASLAAQAGVGARRRPAATSQPARGPANPPPTPGFFFCPIVGRIPGCPRFSPQATNHCGINMIRALPPAARECG